MMGEEAKPNTLPSSQLREPQLPGRGVKSEREPTATSSLAGTGTKHRIPSVQGDPRALQRAQLAGEKTPSIPGGN